MWQREQGVFELHLTLRFLQELHACLEYMTGPSTDNLLSSGGSANHLHLVTMSRKCLGGSSDRIDIE